MMSLMSSTSEDMNHWWFLSCKWSVRWDHFLNYLSWATEFDVRSSFEINICFSSLICEITLWIIHVQQLKLSSKRCHLLNWRAKGPLWTQPPESHRYLLWFDVWISKRSIKNALNIWPLTKPNRIKHLRSDSVHILPYVCFTSRRREAEKFHQLIKSFVICNFLQLLSLSLVPG